MTDNNGDSGERLDLGQCNACNDEPAVGICNVLLGQPMSIAYGRQCLTDGIEAYFVILATVGACTEDYDLPPTETAARQNMAPWALEIIDRSLQRHGKTWQDVERDLGPRSEEAS
jgi:hypothetical protein